MLNARILRVLWLLAGATVLVALAGPFVVRKLVRRQQQAVRSVGLPERFEDLGIRTLPDAANAAAIYRRASGEFQRLQARYAGEWDSFPYTGSREWRALTPAERQRVRAIILHDPDFARFFGLLRQASVLDCQFFTPDEYRKNGRYLTEQGLSELLGQIAGFSGLLAGKAMLEASGGDSETALRDVTTLVRLSRCLAHLPSRQASIGRIARLETALTVLQEHVLPMSVGDGRAEQELLAELRAERNTDYFSCALAGDALLVAEPAFAMHRSGASDLGRSALYARELGYRRTIARLMVLMPRPYWQAYRDLKALLEREETCAERHELLVRLTIPLFNAYEQKARLDRRLAEAEVLLAGRIYRARHGRPAARPEELVPEILPQLPPDPFSGQPVTIFMDAAS